MRIKNFLTATIFSLAVPVLAAAEEILAPGEPYTSERIKSIMTTIANDLIVIGITGAVITIVSAGIIYFTAGFSAKSVDKAKGLFKNALIGTLIILAVGVIINTIKVFVTGEFFGIGK